MNRTTEPLTELARLVAGVPKYQVSLTSAIYPAFDNLKNSVISKLIFIHFDNGRIVEKEM